MVQDSPNDAAGRKICIVIADDHAVLRESIAALFESQPDFDVVGMAGTGNDTLYLVRERNPDVLLLDLFMPNGDGFNVLRSLERNGNRVATLILTGSDNQLDYAQAVRLGARGLVLKGDPPEKLFRAIRAVATGNLAFADDIAQQVVSSIAEVGSMQRRTGIDRLSGRERRVAILVAEGKRNREVAAELGISENTVKRHLQSIFSKTGVRDRLELAVMALNQSSRAA